MPKIDASDSGDAAGSRVMPIGCLQGDDAGGTEGRADITKLWDGHRRYSQVIKFSLKD